MSLLTQKNPKTTEAPLYRYPLKSLHPTDLFNYDRGDASRGLFMKEIRSWIEDRFPSLRRDLFSFLKFKTISTDSSHKHDCISCAEWLRGYLAALQFDAKTIPTSTLPIVYAEDLRAGPNAPTLLIYGHYDVQPVDPIGEWHSDPFDPVEKDGVVYARGAVDDKGQIFYAVAALKAMRELGRKLSVNLKFCIEGEEECGSQGLKESLGSLKELLRADYLLVVDFDLADSHTGAVNLGARGLATFEVVLRGANLDLHSGMYGGLAYNPNRALAELLACCWDKNGKVRVPHFYDKVAKYSKKEKSAFAKALKKQTEQMAKDAGISAFASGKRTAFYEAVCLLPTLEINGIAGGYAGEGFKTVIPKEARAKISCRLVPDQDPEEIVCLVADFLRKNVKQGMGIEILAGHGGHPYRGKSDSALAAALAKAYEDALGTKSVKTLSGGSIPVVADLMRASGAEAVGMGYGLPTDQIHAPNEHFGLDRFKKGIETIVRTIEHLKGA